MTGHHPHNASGAPRRLSKLGLSAQLWPIHLKPQADELLSSWLMRLCQAYAVKPHVFYQHIWPHKQIFNRDIDRSFDQPMLDALAVHTATPQPRVFDTTLEAFYGRVFSNWNVNGNTWWIMPLGIYHRLHKRHGLQFCSACLAEDQKPYFRRLWRLACITVCTQHRCLLFDACPACQAPITFHRTTQSLEHCYQCQTDLSTFQSQAAESDVIEFQQQLEQAIDEHWFCLNNEPVYAVAFFEGLHQMVRLIVSCRKVTALRVAIRRHADLDIDVKANPFDDTILERLRLAERYRAMRYVAAWLSAWPQRFIDVCRSANLYSSALLRDRLQAPYWYWKVVHEHFYYARHTITDAEIVSAAQYLERHNEPVSEQAIAKLFDYHLMFKSTNRSLTDIL